mgnify:FL=1
MSYTDSLMPYRLGTQQGTGLPKHLQNEKRYTISVNTNSSEIDGEVKLSIQYKYKSERSVLLLNGVI